MLTRAPDNPIVAKREACDKVDKDDAQAVCLPDVTHSEVAPDNHNPKRKRGGDL